mgnify:CR=1 FL=1
MLHQFQRRLAQQAQATFAGVGLDFRNGLALDDHLPQFVVQVQQFGNRAASGERDRDDVFGLTFSERVASLPRSLSRGCRCRAERGF